MIFLIASGAFIFYIIYFSNSIWDISGIKYKKTVIYMTRIILYDQKSIHIDGYNNIISFSDETICIQCKKKILEISGTHLYISSFNGIEMTVSGLISGIRWINV